MNARPELVVPIDEATSFPAMWAAWRRTRRGKRRTHEQDAFALELEQNLLRLSRALRDGSWRPGPTRRFEVRDPKLRTVSASPFADRVVHQALVAAVWPALDPLLGSADAEHAEVFSNRPGLGTHRAVLRYQTLARASDAVLVLDVAGYFPSIDHPTVARQLRGWLAPTTPCWALPHLLRVLGTGAADHDAAWFADDDLLEPLRRRRGLPLGNLVSQTVANLHLTPLDDWLREHPAVAGFVRYVDDIFVFGADRAALRDVMAGASDVLGGLRLRFARRKCGVHAASSPVRVLGYVCTPTSRRLPGRSKARFERRFRRYRVAYQRDTLSFDALGQRVASWSGHARFGMSPTALDRFYRRTTRLQSRSDGP